VAHSTSAAGLLARVVVAFALTYVLGYERELRGSPAGDRTFSLIGPASAVLGNLAGSGSPNAVTGIGFIGGGIVVRRAVRAGEIISGSRPRRPPATIAPGNGTTGAIAWLFAPAPGWT
jgi:uncharacterized membrane protein YhiD involved in acid resistance